jgi:hypothetical protein
MTINCGKCGERLREGQEIRGLFVAYYHELRSKVIFSITKPHHYEGGSLEHVNCSGDEE